MGGNMNNSYIISSSEGMDLIEFFEPANFEQSREAIVEVNSGEPARLRLWDVSMGVTLTSEELKQLAQLAAQYPFQEKMKVAYLVREEHAYGAARLFEDMHNYGETAHEVFRDRDEALNWLKA